MSERVRAGVVGVGHMGRYHVGVYHELPQVDLVAVADLDSDKAAAMAAQYHTRPLSDYREMLGEVDVVSVAVPTALHYAVARDCLEAGAHVLVEKPVASSVEQAEELFDIARKNERILQIGHVERFNGAVQELHKIVREPLLIECRRMGPFQARVQEDGVVLDLMIHDLDIVLGLVNAPVRTCYAVGLSVHSPREDIASVCLTFENGCVANLTASRATQDKVRTLTVTQKDAYIFLDYTEQDIRVHRRGASEHTLTQDQLRYRQEAFIERIFVHKGNPLKLEIRHLLDVASNGTAAAQRKDAEQDLKSLRLAFQVLSQIHGQPAPAGPQGNEHGFRESPGR
ncbi:MAG: Gfo/Idh/MocA family protein [Nitrospinota bacterium]